MFHIENSVPKNLLLKEHIEYYYFFKSDNNDFKLGFTHYPHYRTTLNVYLNAEINITQTGRAITFNPDRRIRSIFTNNRDSAKKATVKGNINCIGIVFKPLGFNHFIKDSFYKVIPNPVLFFDNYWLDLNEEMPAVFEAASISEKVRLLDTYFLKYLNSFENDTFKDIVDRVMRSKGAVKVNDLEAQFGISRRTLLRLFRKHLDCSVSYFKQIVKFRSVLDESQQKVEKKILTELAYTNNYYDQSDFINHFKSMAGDIPKQVVTKLITVGTKDMHWKFNK